MMRGLSRQDAVGRPANTSISPLDDGDQHRCACCSGIARPRKFRSDQGVATADFRTIVAEFW
jgi:hypothetical protein